MTWHVDTDLLGRYAQGALPDAAAWSVETHVTACAPCRRALDGSPAQAGAVDDVRLAGVWGAVESGMRMAQRPPTERLLVRLGVADHTACLLAATPSLTASWLLGVALVLATGVLAAWAGPPGEHMLLPYLLLAPLIPVAGVAMAFGPRVDPTYELAVVAPLRASRLLAVRSVAVLSASLLLAAAGALTLPHLGWVTVAWLLPALLLSTSVLALSAHWSPPVAAAVVGTAWPAAVLALETQLAGTLVAFRGTGQAVMALLLAVALAALVVLRERFDPAARR